MDAVLYSVGSDAPGQAAEGGSRWHLGVSSAGCLTSHEQVTLPSTASVYPPVRRAGTISTRAPSGGRGARCSPEDRQTSTLSKRQQWHHCQDCSHQSSLGPAISAGGCPGTGADSCLSRGHPGRQEPRGLPGVHSSRQQVTHVNMLLQPHASTSTPAPSHPPPRRESTCVQSLTHTHASCPSPRAPWERGPRRGSAGR